MNSSFLEISKCEECKTKNHAYPDTVFDYKCCSRKSAKMFCKECFCKIFINDEPASSKIYPKSKGCPFCSKPSKEVKKLRELHDSIKDILALVKGIRNDLSSSK